MSDFHSLTISRISQETPNAVSVTFDIPEHLKNTFRFKAGQYITLKHELNGNEVRRAYSLCCTPSSGALTVGIKKVEGGTFSVYANETLKEGDSLEVMVPEGKFVWDSSVNHHAAFVAGSGITPVLSIVKTALGNDDNSTFLLVYGNQTLAETMFADELATLKETYPDRFSLDYIFSRSQEKNALRGRIDKSVVNYLLKNKYGEASYDRFYLCGPEAMIHEVSETLQGRGVDKTNILFELFTSSEADSPAPSGAGTTQVKVIVDDETFEYSMSQETSILDAALEEDIDPPYSCQGGICSSCIARITEGKAEMRKNQILTDGEVAEGLVLTCQAHPTTPTLVVDYDDV